MRRLLNRILDGVEEVVNGISVSVIPIALIPMEFEAGYAGTRPYPYTRKVLRKTPNRRIAQGILAVYETIELPFYGIGKLVGVLDVNGELSSEHGLGEKYFDDYEIDIRSGQSRNNYK